MDMTAAQRERHDRQMVNDANETSPGKPPSVVGKMTMSPFRNRHAAFVNKPGGGVHGFYAHLGDQGCEGFWLKKNAQGKWVLMYDDCLLRGGANIDVDGIDARHEMAKERDYDVFDVTEELWT